MAGMNIGGHGPVGESKGSDRVDTDPHKMGTEAGHQDVRHAANALLASSSLLGTEEFTSCTKEDVETGFKSAMNELMTEKKFTKLEASLKKAKPEMTLGKFVYEELEPTLTNELEVITGEVKTYIDKGMTREKAITATIKSFIHNTVTKLKDRATESIEDQTNRVADSIANDVLESIPISSPEEGRARIDLPEQTHPAVSPETTALSTELEADLNNLVEEIASETMRGDNSGLVEVEIEEDELHEDISDTNYSDKSEVTLAKNELKFSKSNNISLDPLDSIELAFESKDLVFNEDSYIFNLAKEKFGKGPIKKTAEVRKFSAKIASQISEGRIATLSRQSDINTEVAGLLKAMGGVKDTQSVKSLCKAVADSMLNLTDTITADTDLELLSDSVELIISEMGLLKDASSVKVLNDALLELTAVKRNVSPPENPEYKLQDGTQDLITDVIGDSLDESDDTDSIDSYSSARSRSRTDSTASIDSTMSTDSSLSSDSDSSYDADLYITTFLDDIDEPVSTYGSGPIKNTARVREVANNFAVCVENDNDADAVNKRLIDTFDAAIKLIDGMGDVKDSQSVDTICTAVSGAMQDTLQDVDFLELEDFDGVGEKIERFLESMSPIKDPSSVKVLRQALVQLNLLELSSQSKAILKNFASEVTPYHEREQGSSTYAATFRIAVDEATGKATRASILKGEVPDTKDTHLLFQSVKKILLDDRSPTLESLLDPQREAYVSLAKNMINVMGVDVGEGLYSELSGVGISELPDRADMDSRQYLNSLNELRLSKDMKKNTNETMFTVAVAPSFTSCDDYYLSEAMKGNMVRPVDYFKTDTGKAELNSIIDPYIDGIVKGFAAAAQAVKDAAS